ncbi:MAG: glycoside hydrolase family 2 [Muribaculum sp.]|nr:glycoside hydrolase family 2 [Muribaculaceae bacterium]MCM1081322.1 glycoside hydrolase family 2 [Muribaculum sp.]
MRLKNLLYASGLALIVGTMWSCDSKNEAPDIATIEKNFKDVNTETPIAVYWYWLNDNLTPEGAIKDLEAMKEAGIGRAFIGIQGVENIPAGDAKYNSELYWETIHAALKRASELGIEIGMFNCPGWSQSGGPWIKPEQSMRHIATTSVNVKGEGEQTIKLAAVSDTAQDLMVIAYPALPEAFAAKTKFNFTAGKPVQQTIKPEKADAKMRSIAVTVNTPFNAMLNLYQRSGQGDWKMIKNFVVDRYNPNNIVGFNAYAPVVESLPEVTAEEYMVEMAGSGNGEVEVVLSEAPMVERFAEKSLAKMFQQPLPMWDQYMWPDQPENTASDLVIDPEKVIVIDAKPDAEGNITWNVPQGEWTVERVMLETTGVVNSPATPEATGLEVDKISKKHLQYHFDSYIGEIMKRVPAEDRTTFKYFVEDSYETGGLNWTEELAEKFEQRYGYSPVPYIPTLNGVVVGSPDITNRFLWDLRRLVADLVATEYVGGLKEIANKNGLKTWLENYGHWGFPSEFLMYGGKSDEIGGEFWSEGSLGDIENRAASSCGHTYGKNVIWAESCTSGGPVFSRYPAIMKQRVDRFFTEGINATLLHLYIQQRDDTIEPGLSAWFGNEFNRKNTWFSQASTFFNYLKRCNYMLQQGRYVADVAYFIGEDAPKMTGVCDPELPAGYSFDYINGEILKEHAKVVKGKLVLDSGMEYSLLVLPKQETIRPEMLEKINKLVEDGLNILGPKPLRSPSLQGYPEADKKVAQLADKMWSMKEGENSAKVGKGTVWTNTSIADIFNAIGVEPDLSVPQGEQLPLFIHRTLADAQIYFLANPTESRLEITATFRVPDGMYAQAWDATTGEVRTLPEGESANGKYTMPVSFEPLQSWFIVFRKGNIEKVEGGKNFPSPVVVDTVSTPWTVTFDTRRRGPKQPVVMDQLADWTSYPTDSVRNFSGTAVYKTVLPVAEVDTAATYRLNLGKVMVMATVKVNGQDAGGVWTAPYSVNVTPLLKAGDNEIEVAVVNNYKNRIIGDLSLPEDQRSTWTNIQIWTPNDELQSSGLLGPVTLEKY